MKEELRVGDYIRALWRLKWWIILTTFLVMGATAAVSLKLPKIYRASATLLPPEVDQIWPTPDGVKTRFGAATAGGAMRTGPTATEVLIGILKSRRMAVAVIEAFDLKRVYAEETSPFKLPRMPWQKSGGNGEPLLSDTIEKLTSRVEMRLNKEGLLAIAFEDRDPQRAAAVVKFYLDELQRMNIELQTTYTQYFARVLDAPAVPDKKHKPNVKLHVLASGALLSFAWIVGVLGWLSFADLQRPCPVKQDKSLQPALADEPSPGLD